jgi:26S proteasome regulatory subunit T6
MYALRERRQHVTQEDFEFAVAKVCVDCVCYCNALTALMQVLKKNQEGNTSVNKLFS